MINHQTLTMRSLSWILCAFLAAWPRCAMADTAIMTEVARGISYRSYQYDNLNGGPQRLHVLDIDLQDPAVSFHFPYALGDANGDPYQTVPQFAARIPNAVGAINGQVFHKEQTGGSLPFLKVNDKVISPGGLSEFERCAIGALTDGRAGGFERPRAGWSSLTDVPTIMASGPYLISLAKIRTDYPSDPLYQERRQRTAVAYTYDYHMLLIVLEGGQPGVATGMNLPELANIIKKLGMVNLAWVLDGDASSTFWVQGSVRNHLSEGAPLPVANAVVVASQALPPSSDIILDNLEAVVPISWVTTFTTDDPYGPDVRLTFKGNGQNYAEYRPDIPDSGQYEVWEWHSTALNFSTVTPHVILHGLGSSTIYVNQTISGGRWNLLGRYSFNAGTEGAVRITDGFKDGATFAVADAIKFVRMPAENALRVHGGLASSTSENTLLLDTWPGGTPTGVITLEDAVRNARRAAGLDP